MSEKEIIVGAKIPAQIATAIMKVAMEIPSLVKEEENKYAHYSYVSIDAYYHAVRKVAAANALWWHIWEDKLEMLGEQTIKFHYTVDLFHADGTVLPGYGQFSILHPLQGPQTSGSAMSYAEKLFMRVTFKIETGEEDADAVDPKTVKHAPKPQGASPRPAVAVLEPKPADVTLGPSTGSVVISGADYPMVGVPQDANGWDLVMETFKTFLPSVKDDEDLKSFWRLNTAAIERLEVQRPELFAQLKAAFAARRKEIKSEPKA